MRRVATIVTLLAVVFALVAVSACGGDSEPAAEGSANITFWTGFTERELGVMKDVVADFEKQHPNIHVKVVGGIDDDKIVAAIRGGTAGDVLHSFASDNTGAFCSNGAWIDLADYMEQDDISDDIFPPAPRYYTQYNGTRCALPMPAEDHVGAHGLRQEADGAESGRLPQGRRHRSAGRVLRECSRPLGAFVGRRLDGRLGQVEPLYQPRLGEDASVAEGAHRLVRL